MQRTMSSHYDEELIDYENEPVDYIPGGPTASSETNRAGPVNSPGEGDYELIDYEDVPDVVVPNGATASSATNGASTGEGDKDKQQKFTSIHSTGFRYVQSKLLLSYHDYGVRLCTLIYSLQQGF